jgi:hypothetical protein
MPVARAAASYIAYILAGHRRPIPEGARARRDARVLPPHS